MKNVVIIGVLLLFIGITSYLVVSGNGSSDEKRAVAVGRNAPSTWRTLAGQLQESGWILNEIAIPTLPADAALQTLTFDADALSQNPLLIKTPTNDAVMVITSVDKPLGIGSEIPITETCRICISEQSKQLFLDGAVKIKDLTGWQLYHLSKNDAVCPMITPSTVDACVVKDGFMRKTLLDDNWRITEGTWTLKQYGGGMPSNTMEMKSHMFSRTVNPFSVCGKGIMTYGNDTCIHHTGEASFYFGIPWKESAVNKSDLPPGKVFMMQGLTGGTLIGFGWHPEPACFVIATRGVDGIWSVLKTTDGKRPPISNWVRIGLRIRNGHTVEGLLDGKVSLTHDLKQMASGPFRIVCSEITEFDDVAIAPLKKIESKGSPIHVRSRNFSGKRQIYQVTNNWTSRGIQQGLDSSVFGKWARGDGTFLRTTLHPRAEPFSKAIITTRVPIYGDFTYTNVPETDVAGKLPYGLYEISVLVDTLCQPSPAFQNMTAVHTFRLGYTPDGWHQMNGSDDGVGEPTLRFRRRQTAGNTIEVFRNGGFSSISPRVDGPVHIAITRLFSKKLKSATPYPNPLHHAITSTNHVNELFEKAASDWSWIDGGFRMDARWACSERWNFMACGARGVPMMVSKRMFSGDQHHDYFVSLRPVFPSDAGDTNFTFDFDTHGKFQSKFNDWTIRRDLNFSFCMDGRNPLSGYSVIFGDGEKGDTLLLRNGAVIARNKDLRFPTGNYRNVHWKWWEFSVSKQKDRICVMCGSRKIFDLKDTSPLTGGHIAFWTVRNGFIVSKVSSSAETIGWQPDALYVTNDSEESSWKPLLRDSVTVTKQGTDSLVTANSGAGTMATRHTCTPPIILKRTPILELPIDVPDGTRVNLHLMIDDTSYIVQINSPLQQCKAFLTPEYEPDFNNTVYYRDEINAELRKNECFQLKPIPSKQIEERSLLATHASSTGTITLDIGEALKRVGHKGLGLLRSLTIGNSSNQGYLLAGSTANRAGSTYKVGEPVFSK